MTRYEELMRKADVLKDASKRAEDSTLKKVFEAGAFRLRQKARFLTIAQAHEVVK